MSLSFKVLQVGTLVAFSVVLTVVSPEKNANVLPIASNTALPSSLAAAPIRSTGFSEPAQDSEQNNEPVIQKVPRENLTTTNAGFQVESPDSVNEGPSQDVLFDEQKVEQESEKASNSLPESNIEYSFYGTPDQPGYQIQVAIFNRVEQGFALEQAAQQTIKDIVDSNNIISDALAMAAIYERPSLAEAFVLQIAQSTQLLEATKLTMENNPGQLNSIIGLGVTLYPEFTRDIITAAALTGEVSEEDAILVAIAAGADPTLLALSTAAGSNVPGLASFSAVPLGSGIGAGGTGGGDTTASTN